MVVAAGSGQRVGAELPKQYLPLGGHRVLDWSLAVAHQATDGVVLVVPPDRASLPEPAADHVVPGGANRSASVRAGLAAVPADAEIVVVHDAARPLATSALFASVLEAVEAGADAAVPGLPVVDTIKRVRAGEVTETLERADLLAVQTPQAFRAEILRRAHAGDGVATDDAALVEAIGGRVAAVLGDPANRKLTRPDDLDALERELGSMEGPAGGTGEARGVVPGSSA